METGEFILSAGDSNVKRIKTRFKRFILDEKPLPIVKLTTNREIDNNYQNIQIDCLKLLHDLCGRGFRSSLLCLIYRLLSRTLAWYL